MNAKAVAALPPVDALPNAARIVADQGQRGQFQALIGAPARAEHRAANAAAHASDNVTSKVKAVDDNATAAAAAATAAPLPPPAPKPDAAASSAPTSPALPTLASSTPNAGTAPAIALSSPIPAVAAPSLPTGAAQAAATTPALPMPQLAVPLPAATPDPNAAQGNASSTPTASAPSTAATDPANAAAAAASTPVQSMAAALGLRLVAGASNLPQSPRTPLIDLASPPDKTAAAAPTTASHPALALDVLQGVAKTPVDATPDTGAKLLDAAAKDIVAVQAAPLARDEATPVAADPSPAAAPTSPSNDALAAQMTPAPAATAAPTPAASAAPTLMAHAVAEQVAVSLRQAAKSGDDHIQIQLQPAELGAIAVKLNVNHDGRVTMVVSADRSDTLNMLQQDSATLTQALRDAGLQADSSSLSFNLRGFQMNQQASQDGASWRDAASASGGDDLGAVASVMPTLRRHSGALDIHV